MKDLDRIFEFEKTDNGYKLSYYLLADDESVNRVDIPSEYKGKPVTEIADNTFMFLGHITEVNIPEGIEKIGFGAFSFCRIKTITFPKTLREIGSNAFAECDKLERVNFQSDNVEFGYGVFDRCPELAAENIMQSLARSCDITKPFVNEEDYMENEPGVDFDWDNAMREDVLSLAIKNDSFALFDKEDVLREMVEYDMSQALSLAEAAGWSITKELSEELLEISADNGYAETTAWLLDHKNRKIGFGKA